MVERDVGSCNPHFFKPLLPGFSKKLAVPTGFVKHIGKKKCSRTTATIVSPNGESWHVNVYNDRMQENMYFGGDGWLKFVHAHNLEPGYFLVFRYRGNMVFSFRAYDLSTCEITSYASTDVREEDVSNNENNADIEKEKMTIPEVKVEYLESSEDDIENESNEHIGKKKKKTPEVKIEIEDSDEFSTPKKKRKVSVDKFANHKDCGQIFPDKWVTKNSTNKRMINSKSHERIKRNNWSATGEKAQFKGTIWPCNISSHYMNIPWKFSDASGLTEHRKLTLVNPRGRSWQVCLMHRRTRFGNGRNSSCMTVGWLDFAVANKLKLGDKCNFELGSETYNREPVVLKVQVCKKSV